MGVDYDTWLQKPYQDRHEAQDAYDEAEEAYRESDSYHEHYGFWLETKARPKKIGERPPTM